MNLSHNDMRDNLRYVYRLAEHSSDRSTHNGAIILNEEGDIIATGANSHVKGYGDEEIHHERPLKYLLTEHAERAAIIDAARNGVGVFGCTMVANWVACPSCARAISLAGITKVICHKQCMDRTPKRWLDEVNLGLEILKNSGVEVIQWDGKVDRIDNLNNGEIWLP